MKSEGGGGTDLEVVTFHLLRKSRATEDAGAAGSCGAASRRGAAARDDHRAGGAAEHAGDVSRLQVQRTLRQNHGHHANYHRRVVHGHHGEEPVQTRISQC